MNIFDYKLEYTDGKARAGVFKTEHGLIETPVFMPVGTKASVKWITNEDLDEMWAQIILNNTYHLYLRPGDEVVKHFGWVHKFQNYHKPILTDSGWFQVFSLWNPRKAWENSESMVKITEEWVHFRSVIDGSKHFFSPEKVMDIESNLWADIIMAFDECASGDSSYEYAKKAMNRTHNWVKRCKTEWLKNEHSRQESGQHKQALFWISQWVIYDDLRIESAKFIADMDTPGVAIGWLSVWESKEDMYRTLDVIESFLPKNKPRYLMGVGTPEDLIEAIYRGVDMFDCVLPTRIWRHGTAFSSKGYVKVRNNQYKLSDKPLDEHCSCKVCKNYSMWYLRHLTVENELLWMKILSYHNLFLLIHLANNAREAIKKWEFENFRKIFWTNYKI